jgi:hypothetical protein
MLQLYVIVLCTLGRLARPAVIYQFFESLVVNNHVKIYACVRVSVCECVTKTCTQARSIAT